MNVCFFTLGSRGDVQPYVALAKGLIKSGHSATICTGSSFKELIESNEITFKETASDLMAVANTPEGKMILEAPLRHIIMAMRFSKEVLNPAYRKTLDDFFEGAKDADIIVYHPKALGAVDIALHYDIPCVSMPPVPITYPITEFPNLAVSPSIQLGKKLNQLSYQINVKAESSQIKEINDFRLKTLGLSPRKAGLYAFKRGNEDISTIYPLSPLLFPDVHSWLGHVFLPGFFFLQSEENQLSQEIETFLSEGETPIAVTFSSMPLKNPTTFMANLYEALKSTRNRAIVLVGNSGIQYKSNQHICVVKAAPHDILFARTKGVIHHGGVGTMSAALRAGIPQQIIPFSVDQPFWAKRLYALGYCLKPLKQKKLTVENLENTLRQIDNPRIKTIAKEVGFQIKNENGIEDTIKYLEALLH